MEFFPSLTIGALANAAGVNVETIPFYQRKQLLDRPKRLAGAIRRYRLEDVARVRCIKAAQRLSFTLHEIHALLNLDDGALSAMVAECCATTGQMVCPLTASLQSGSAPLSHDG